MALLELGYTVQKFFPAEQAGGAPYLKSIGSPIPQVSFCPTGGISLKNARDYLGLKNILAGRRVLGGAERGDGQGRLGGDHHAGHRGCATALKHIFPPPGPGAGAAGAWAQAYGLEANRPGPPATPLRLFGGGQRLGQHTGHRVIGGSECRNGRSARAGNRRC